MAEISLDKRVEFTEKCINYFAAMKKEQDLGERDLIVEIYNHAIRDAVDAMEVYIEKNPQHKIVFDALKDELKWMPLVKE